jgi:hypothetical protein
MARAALCLLNSHQHRNALRPQGQLQSGHMQGASSLRRRERSTARFLCAADLDGKPVPSRCGQSEGRGRNSAIHSLHRKTARPIEQFRRFGGIEEVAEYLDDLRDRFGNLGLAAAAYNAGEGGLQTFLKNGSLPQENRNYVLDITAHAAEDWRDNPPAAIDLRLDGQKSFEDACIALADTRRLKALEFEAEGVWAPWGAQLAGHFQKPVAVRLFLSTVRSLPAPLNKEKPLIQKERNRAFGTRVRYTARIGRPTRQEAEAVCREVRKSGAACIVFRN